MPASAYVPLPLPAPADPAFADRVRASFACQGALSTIGAWIDDVQPGRVLVHLPHAAHVTQQHGFVHGGLLAAVLDTACGYAASTLTAADAGVLTVEFKINFLAPARGPVLHCEGWVTKAGRTLSVTEGRAWQDGADGQPQLVATLNATIMTITGREGVRD
jgi:uncharacterized protein (TIGR00369 family)